MGAHLFGCAIPLAAYGSAQQSQRWKDCLADGSVVGALAVTEASGGSSFDLLTTEAREVSGGYLLNGEKTLIANAPVAGLFLVLARQFRSR
jgi:alkylation response protein AidB-like acyl-CoA dehydrogenase